jgi:hypothetical protein
MDVILSSVCRKGEGEIIDRPKNKLIIISSPPIPTHTHERWDIGRQEELANLLVCVWDGRRASQCIQYHHKSLSYTSKLRPCTHKPEGCRHSTTHTQELEKRRGKSKIGSRILRVNQKLFNALILDIKTWSQWGSEGLVDTDDGIWKKCLISQPPTHK